MLIDVKHVFKRKTSGIEHLKLFNLIYLRRHYNIIYEYGIVI